MYDVVVTSADVNYCSLAAMKGFKVVTHIVLANLLVIEANKSAKGVMASDGAIDVAASADGCTVSCMVVCAAASDVMSPVASGEVEAGAN